MSEEEQLAGLVASWIDWDKNLKTRKEIDDLVLDNALDELKPRLLGRMAFGTAGMRARMEAGYTRMNDLTIIQTTQGFAAYLKELHDETALRERGVVIGFDTRHNSERFARLAANVMCLNKIRVHFYSKYVPTPLVPFAMNEYKSVAGIMVTASHNPKDDNGYKAYWSNGAQILAPHDKNICDRVLKNLKPIDHVWEIERLDTCDLLHDLCSASTDSNVLDTYYSRELNLFCYRRACNERSAVRFAYTPVHGVGLAYTPRALAAFGFPSDNVVFVESQKDPDPDFPTAPFPNPEEGEGVLRPALQCAEEHNCAVILANDPDADRFQISERQSNGEWHFFTGNEMGSLLAWYTWTCLKEKHTHIDGSKVTYVNSAVSTKFVGTMAKKEGFNYEETLTGFKFMGNRSEQLRSQGITVPLAWEESIGYMPGSSLDKDGVLTAAMFAEMTAFLYEQKKTLLSHLHHLYTTYGFHISTVSYFICADPVKMRNVFNRIRYGSNTNTGNKLKYPTKIGQYEVCAVRDLTVGYDSNQPDNKPILPVSGSSQMITFTLAQGSTVTVRGSGTEPKLKYYVELITLEGRPVTDLPVIQDELEHLVDAVINELLRPVESGLDNKPEQEYEYEQRSIKNVLKQNTMFLDQ